MACLRKTSTTTLSFRPYRPTAGRSRTTRICSTYGGRRLFIDLGAERATIGAERGSERIAVEVSSFVAESPVRDLQEAVGQFVVYRTLLTQAEPERTLFLGVPTRVYDSVLSEPLGQVVAAEVRLRILVFDPQQQKVVRWIN